MKNDLKKFLELFESFGIPLSWEKLENGFSITMTADSHPKIKGYPGFYGQVEFDKNGKFKEIVFEE